MERTWGANLQRGPVDVRSRLDSESVFSRHRLDRQRGRLGAAGENQGLECVRGNNEATTAALRPGVAASVKVRRQPRLKQPHGRFMDLDSRHFSCHER